AGEWYYDAVAYTYGMGLMNGTGDGTKFSPSMNLTRGMVVTVLYRNYGAPEVHALNPFADVKEDAYYGAAAVWAYHSKVVTGTGEDEWGDPLFSPDRNITRQELATMIGRYAAFCHVDTTKNTADIAVFPDSGKVASWAADTVKWAAGTGIITGKGTGSSATLSPEDLATRAEFATIIKRFNDKDDAREFTYKLAYTEPMPKSSYTEPTYEPCDDADVFVSVDGVDTNPGTKDKPLATFEGARNKVRELKKTATDEIVVAFMAGNYGTLDNITFTAEDSGTSDVPVTYRAYGDGDVIFQNGVSISESEFVKVDESDYYLLGNVDKSKVYKADLSEKIESFTSSSILFSETGICHEARVPNKGSGSIENAYWNVTTTYNERESILLQSYLPGKLEELRTIEGMKVTGMLRTGWLVDTFPVKSYDKDTKVLTFDFDDPSAFGNGYTLDHFVLAFEGRMDDYLYFHNLSDQIDAEGEYWFDQSTKTLYMYDPKGDYYISESGKFMSIYTGAEYLSFVGLDFIATTDSAIELDSSHITFDDCKIGNVAGHAAIYSIGEHPVCFITIKNCEIYNFVDTGIEIDSDKPNRESLEPTGIVIENNYFHDFS
ncbi:MAG: S-layer homology domain-containing protein, partial [Clostridia bacterium]|nr:S-layer homology domain-containing protein [Clostridia bacterium]